MARRKEISKHPAIMANKAAAAEVTPVADADATVWDRLTSDQRAFISLMGIHHDVNRTAAALGKSLSWVTAESKASPVFADAVKHGVGSTTEVGTKMMQMAIPYTVMRLLEIVEKEPNNQVVLAAIKHIHDATGLNQKAQPTFGGNFLNVNVKMFGDKEDKVIDVE